MATQTLEFTAATGLTITCKIFAVGSGTLVDSATATEKTNDKNRYSVSYTDIPAGTYRLNGFVSDVGGFANEIYDLTLTTATFYPRSEASVTLDDFKGKWGLRDKANGDKVVAYGRIEVIYVP